jgi:hypothetical protein
MPSAGERFDTQIDSARISPEVHAPLAVVPAIQLAKYMIETGSHIPAEPQGSLDARFREAMDAAPVMI